LAFGRNTKGLRGILAAAALCISVVATSAHTLYLFGDIGKFPVLVMIDRDGSRLSGWYFYMRQAQEIRLDGTIDAKGQFVLDEYDTHTGWRTAHFAGTATKTDWSGTWQGGGVLLPFALHQSAGESLDGRYRCSSKKTDKQFGYTYTGTIDLGIAQGKVTRLALDNEAKSKYDAQSCSIDLKSLHKKPSDAGILLRSGTGNGDINEHCSIRFVGNGSYIYVRIGDANETNDDCKGDDEEMFCSARGSWTDLVVERKTRVCRAVE